MKLQDYDLFQKSFLKVDQFFFDSLVGSEDFVNFGEIANMSDKHSVLNGLYNNVNIRTKNKKLLWSDFVSFVDETNFSLNVDNLLYFDVFNNRKDQINIKDNLFKFLVSPKNNIKNEPNLSMLNNCLYNYNDFLEINR
ncbi:hypothetical protein [Thauera sp.]|uniref:hypothetical protein n=1 Tax=Thauera sp. TaxID=1905334 RepID=UPI002C71704A|nr:hypothetical protein [Thauera sp.]HRP26117.1 hypothetical protein [Thauera sp.]